MKSLGRMKNKQEEDALSNSEIIDDNYCIDKKVKKKRKRKMRFPFLTPRRDQKRKPNLIEGYLPIEKYLATERLKSDKVTYKSVEKLDI